MLEEATHLSLTGSRTQGQGNDKLAGNLSNSDSSCRRLNKFWSAHREFLFGDGGGDTRGLGGWCAGKDGGSVARRVASALSGICGEVGAAVKADASQGFRWRS
jgi:hypothetical protein